MRGSPPDKIAIIYVPCGSQEEAAHIARALLDEGLIACANILQARSLYRWEGKLADEQEQILLCKTSPARAEAAQRAILRLHSYDVPCVLQLETASVNHEYAKWVFARVAGRQLDAQKPGE